MLAEKFRDAIYHVFLGVARDFRINRQGQRFAGRASCFREIARLITEIFEARLLVERERIIDRRIDLVFRKVLAQFVALLSSNHILMVDVMVLESALRIPLHR